MMNVSYEFHKPPESVPPHLIKKKSLAKIAKIRKQSVGSSVNEDDGDLDSQNSISSSDNTKLGKNENNLNVPETKATCEQQINSLGLPNASSVQPNDLSSQISVNVGRCRHLLIEKIDEHLSPISVASSDNRVTNGNSVVNDTDLSYEKLSVHCVDDFKSKSICVGGENINQDPSYSTNSTAAFDASTTDDFSESGASITSNAGILPPISTFDARKRSYLAGCVSGHRSLLGSDELARYFPDRKVKVFVGTWNMNGKIPVAIEDFLLPHDIMYLPDIYAIGTQESLIDKRDWDVMMQTTIGPSHVLFHSASIGVLYLSIYIRRDLIWFCSLPEESQYTTRPVTAIKTKGAIGVGFAFFGTSLLFITSHFCAHDYKLREREAEYNTIRKNLNLPKNNISNKMSKINADVTERYDCVFWCGDLNYRITTEHSVVLNILNNSDTEIVKRLLHGDQLLNEMKIQKVFRGFEEAQIQFSPTYKYIVGTDDFDSSQKPRTPSFTDRILYRYRRKNCIKCNIYNSVPSIKDSDHKPVYGLFEVKVRPGTDNIALSAGLFNRDVYLEAIKQRSLHLIPSEKPEGSAVCSVM